MAIVDDLNRLRDWLQEEVCDKVSLKMPTAATDDDVSSFEVVNPTAFILYQPGKDRLPPNVKAPIPSVCIRMTEGEHLTQESTGTMEIMLNFCTWNPGLHSSDVFTPIDGAGINGYNQGVKEAYKRTADGWQDVYSFVDTTLRTIEKAEYIAGMRLVAEKGVKFGMIGNDDLSDFYPIWLAWVSFTLQTGNVRPKSFDELL